MTASRKDVRNVIMLSIRVEGPQRRTCALHNNSAPETAGRPSANTNNQSGTFWREAGRNPPTRTRTARFRGCLLPAIAILVALAGPRHATAQGFRIGISKALPAPVSSLELARYAAMLTLSLEQQHAWAAAHDRYKSDFRALGEGGGAIAAFIEARKATEGVPFGAQPPRSDIERWMNAHAAVFGAIAALDARLFDELAPLLTEDQQPRWQRAKLLRDRARLAGDELVSEWLDMRTTADLCVIFTRFEADFTEPLPAEQVQAAWTVLDSHQAHFVKELRGVQEDARDMYRAWARLLEDRGVPVNAVDLRQRDTMDREMFRQVSAAWFEVTQKVKPRLTEMAKANRAKAKSIATVLPAPAGNAFLRKFMDAAYVGAPVMVLDNHEQTLRRALEMPDLTEAERAALLAQIDECARTIKAIGEQAGDAIDLLNEGQRPNSSGQSPQARQAMTDVIAASNDAAARMRQSFNDLISVDRQKAHAGAGRDDRMRKMIRDGGVSDPEEVEELLAQLRRTGRIMLGPRGTPDNAMADALGKVDVQAIIKSLNVPEESVSIVRQLHADYFRMYRAQFDEATFAIQQAAVEGFGPRPDGKGGRTMGFAPPEEIEQTSAMESRTIAALRELDRAFFDDVQAALGLADDALWRARLAREWATLARGGRHGSSDLRTYEAYVPVATILDDLELSSEESTKADEVLRRRADEVRAVALAQLEANRAAWYARALALTHETPAPASAAADGGKFIQHAQELEERAAARRVAMATLVRAIIDELAVVLPARESSLREAWERSAFPRDFDDRDNQAAALARALALPDLADPQRSELQAAAAAYGPAYRDVCERLIEANREWDRPRPYSQFQNPEREAAKLKWNQLIFERTELNAGVAATLQRVLTPEQRAAIAAEPSGPAGDR